VISRERLHHFAKGIEAAGEYVVEGEPEIPSARQVERPPRPETEARPSREGKAPGRVKWTPSGVAPARPGKKRPSWPTTRLYIGAGREAGIKPADLVGAITNETGVESRALGAIQVGERYSLVEVPEEIADVLVNALRHTRLKGKKVVIRRDASKAR
jgi:ATP-dependent RNA helicase DeaD